MIVSPASLTVKTSQSATFTTTVSGIGKENFTYQWQHNEEDVDGETGDTLNLNNVAVKDKGSYQCIVKNQYGDSDVFTVELEVTSKHETCVGLKLFYCFLFFSCCYCVIVLLKFPAALLQYFVALKSQYIHLLIILSFPSGFM